MPKNISNTNGGSNPEISSEENNVYVVWDDFSSGNFEILFAASNNNGQTFSTPPDNLSNNAGISLDQQISSEGNNVYVVWLDDTSGNSETFFAVSNDNGQTFSNPPDNLSNDAGESFGQQISSSSTTS
jgi:hypothetical protein